LTVDLTQGEELPEASNARSQKKEAGKGRNYPDDPQLKRRPGHQTRMLRKTAFLLRCGDIPKLEGNAQAQIGKISFPYRTGSHAGEGSGKKATKEEKYRNMGRGKFPMKLLHWRKGRQGHFEGKEPTKPRF